MEIKLKLQYQEDHKTYLLLVGDGAVSARPWFNDSQVTVSGSQRIPMNFCFATEV
jgi:hypothetical protein